MKKYFAKRGYPMDLQLFYRRTLNLPIVCTRWGPFLITFRRSSHAQVFASCKCQIHPKNMSGSICFTPIWITSFGSWGPTCFLKSRRVGAEWISCSYTISERTSLTQRFGKATGLIRQESGNWRYILNWKA